MPPNSIKSAPPKPHQRLGVGLVIVGLLGLGYFYFGGDSLSGFQSPNLSESGGYQKRSCKVLKVLDGDTVGCDLNQNGFIESPQEHIRLLGVDTPEMHYSKKNKTGIDEPFAPESSQYTKEHLLNVTVYLEGDQRPQDRFGRTLSYLYLHPDDTVTYNETLLSQGLARTLFIPPNLKYQHRFQQVEEQAELSGIGLWGVKP
ncbi:MAG: thermonuclease family protein [Cyanobacteria bacterium]|nr:thermonuclease family protein [Cyanobacteriota bacterium]